MKAVESGGVADFEGLLDIALEEFDQAYLAADAEFRQEQEVLNAQIEAAPGGVLYASGGGQVIAPTSAPGWGEPLLATQVSPFRGMGSPLADDPLQPGVERACESLPEEGPHYLLDVVDHNRGPAAQAYKWHFKVLRWSLGHQYEILKALTGLSAACERLDTRTRTNVLTIINAGTQALRQAAAGGAPNVTIDLEKIGLDALYSGVVGGLKGGLKGAGQGLADSLKGSLIDIGLDWIDDSEEEQLSGTAKQILASTQNNLAKLRTSFEHRRDVLLRCLTEVEHAINHPEPFNQDEPHWNDLKIPLPGSRR